MDTDPPHEAIAQARPVSRLSWPAAALVIVVLAVLAWGLFGGVIWSFLR